MFRNHYLILLFLFFYVSACKKTSINDNSPIIGIWKMEMTIPYSDEKVTSVNTNDIGKYVGVELTIDFRTEGMVIFNGFEGKEKFKIVKINEREFPLVYSPANDIEVVDGFVLTLKDWKGQKFYFKYFIEPFNGKLVGVGWYKNLPYTTTDRPVTKGNYYNSYFESYSEFSNQLGYDEVLCTFTKL